MKKTMHRNDGTDENHIAQNKFTAYLISAFLGHKQRYLEKKSKLYWNELLTLESETLPIDVDFDKELEQIYSCKDVLLLIENHKLQQYMAGLTERQTKILILRVIFELSFSQIGTLLKEDTTSVKNCYYYIKNRCRY